MTNDEKSERMEILEQHDEFKTLMNNMTSNQFDGLFRRMMSEIVELTIDRDRWENIASKQHKALKDMVDMVCEEDAANG